MEMDGQSSRPQQCYADGDDGDLGEMHQSVGKSLKRGIYALESSETGVE